MVCLSVNCSLPNVFWPLQEIGIKEIKEIRRWRMGFTMGRFGYSKLVKCGLSILEWVIGLIGRTFDVRCSRFGPFMVQEVS